MHFSGREEWMRSNGKVLLLVCALHIAIFLAWPMLRPVVLATERMAGQLIFIDAPVPPKPPELKKVIVPAPSPATARPPSPTAPRSPIPLNMPVQTVGDAPAAETTVPAQPAAQGDAAPAITINRDLGHIYKDVQREVPNRNIEGQEKPGKSSMITFANNVAAAAKVRGTEYKNFTLPDGTAITKVTTSSGSYCVVGGTTNAANFGRAPGIRTVSCGNY